METRAIVDIHQVLYLFGHCVDRDDWPGLADVFDNDVRYDATDEGLVAVQGLASLVSLLSQSPRPLAHHVTNPYVWTDEGGPTRARSKVLGVVAEGRVESRTCSDVLRMTDRGWRIAERTITIRRPSDLPHPLFRYVVR